MTHVNAPLSIEGRRQLIVVLGDRIGRRMSSVRFQAWRDRAAGHCTGRRRRHRLGHHSLDPSHKPNDVWRSISHIEEAGIMPARGWLAGTDCGRPSLCDGAGQWARESMNPCRTLP